MKRDMALERGLDVINHQQFLYFSTVGGDGFPRTRVMFNLHSAEHYPHVDRSIYENRTPFSLFIGTNTSSEKIPQIQENDRVSVYFNDLKTWEAILLTGRIVIEERMEIKKAIWTDSWKTYYPQGIRDPDFCLLHFKPEKAEVYGGGEVHHFEGKDLSER